MKSMGGLVGARRYVPARGELDLTWLCLPGTSPFGHIILLDATVLPKGGLGKPCELHHAGGGPEAQRGKGLQRSFG